MRLPLKTTIAARFGTLTSNRPAGSTPAASAARAIVLARPGPWRFHAPPLPRITLSDCKSRPKRRLQAGGTRFAVRSEGWVPASPGERLAAARGRVCRAKTAQRSMTTDFSIIEKHLAPSCALKRFSLIYDLGDGTRNPTSCDGSWSCDAGCATNVFANTRFQPSSPNRKPFC